MTCEQGILAVAILAVAMSALFALARALYRRVRTIERPHKSTALYDCLFHRKCEVCGRNPIPSISRRRADGVPVVQWPLDRCPDCTDDTDTAIG